MTVTEEMKMDRIAARREALYALQEYAAGLVDHGYAQAAMNAWDAKLDEWAERVGV